MIERIPEAEYLAEEINKGKGGAKKLMRRRKLFKYWTNKQFEFRWEMVLRNGHNIICHQKYSKAKLPC